MSIKGSCLCKAIAFKVDEPVLWCAHCHCTQCQREHGAAFVTWVGSKVESISILDTESQLHWYQSSPKARRGFCGRCGSSLFFESSDWPGELHVVRANLEGEISPQGHAFYDTHVSWVELADDLPRKADPG